MKEDRFLTVILIVVALLVIVSVGVFVSKKGDIAYLPEDTPEGIVHNYILAIQNSDYKRAYAYLSEGEDKPSYSEFEQYFIFDSAGDNVPGMQIGETTITTNIARVGVSQTQNSNSIFFDRYYFYEDNARLKNENGAWKLTYMPYRYWGWEWYEEAK